MINNQTKKDFKNAISTVMKIVVVIGLIGGAYAWATVQGERRVEDAKYVAQLEKEQIRAEFEDKISDRKYEIVDMLSNQCEVLGIKEHKKDGKIIWDTNNKPSLGRWMFQIDTVKYYSEKLRGEKLSDDEAIILAVTEIEARELAFEIIWDETGGIYNWKNCMIKLDLKSKIESIRMLEK